jgi:chemotaxis protein MotB
LDSNETSLGRAKNRRVEIVVRQGLDKELADDLQVLKEEDPEYYESLELEDAPAFDLNSGEIF